MDPGSDPKAARRKRVSRACDRCRSKKDKCDGLRPACSACQASGQTCSYDPNAKKRGLPEGYVRGLEKLWALGICNIDGFEDTMLGMLGATDDSASRRSRLMSLWADDSASETLHETWKSSHLFGALERMLSNSEVPSPQIPDKRQRESEQGNWGFRIGRSSTPLGPDAPRVVEPSASPKLKKPRLTSPGAGGAVHPARSPSSLQLPPQTSQLLDVYFAITHTWFPIVAKHNILRASYMYANAPLSVENVKSGSGDHAALWAILSYTVSQSKSSSSGQLALLSKVKEYSSISRNLIPSEREGYELGHVQALLLLALVNIGLEDWSAAWLMSAQAVRAAITMGLGTYVDTQRSDETRQGRAVFLGCFVIDSLLAFRLGRSPCMHQQDIAMVGRLEEDGLEEWNSWADVLPPTRSVQAKNPPRRGPLLALSCFNRLVELAGVLNRISRDSSDEPKAHMFAQQLASELKQWDDHLPLGCRLIGPESLFPERHSALLPHQTYLSLTYVSTLMWVYLRVVPKEMGLHSTQRPATEGAKRLLFRALTMISQHLENFQICGLPPIFEVTIRSIGSQALSLRDVIEPRSFPFPHWLEGISQCTAELKPTWPVYESLDLSIGNWRRYVTANGPPMTLQGHTIERSESSGSTGGLHEGGIPMPDMGQMGHPRQNEFATHQHGKANPLQANTNQDYTSSILGISIPADKNYTTPKDTEMETVDLSMPDQSPANPSPDKPPDFLDKLAQSNSPDLMSPNYPQPSPNTMSNIPPPTTTPRTDHHRLSGGEALELSTKASGSNSNFGSPEDMSSDIDSIFKDLAYLDTTEWAVSREAGLKDFGFMDDTTFQAFCHDPDRLEGSQPLVHPSSIADIWPPPGFFPEAFQEGNPNSNSNEGMGG